MCFVIHVHNSWFLIQSNEEPFYAVDLGQLVKLHAGWERALPNVRPFYAVKCNDDAALLKTLAVLGTGFDCASNVRHDTTV